VTHPPYLPPWVRVLFFIRSITSTTWGHEAWPLVKPLLRRALEMRRQIARDGWWTDTRRPLHRRRFGVGVDAVAGGAASAWVALRKAGAAEGEPYG
jgi:hypothetical protein